jgi:hypothetical protein
MLGACFMLVSCLAYSSTLKIKNTGSSETSVGFGLHCVISRKTDFGVELAVTVCAAFIWLRIGTIYRFRWEDGDSLV